MHSNIGLLAAAIALALGGCTATLQPAPGAQLANDGGAAAVSRAQGVELIVEADDWSAFPRSLERKMTPMRATITNNSSHPLEIKYENFSLKSGAGVTYHPLPPLDIKGHVTQRSAYPVIAPRFVHRGFFISPYYDPYYTIGVVPWAYGWPSDPIYYQRYYPTWHIDLPTTAMLELAIPEGVVEPNGEVSGFLYFPELAADKGDRLTFSTKLVDAKTEDSFGRLGIPFVLQ